MPTYTIQYLSTNAAAVALKKDKFVVVNESTTARTLALTDADKYIRCTNSGAINITVPPQATIAWLSSTSIIVEKSGTGNVTIVAGAGVTLNAPAGLVASTQYGYLELFRTASDVWTVSLLPGTGYAGVATDTIFDAAGDLIQGTGANTAARLPIGTALKVLRVNSGATALEWATANTGDALVANPLSQFAATTSAQLAGVISDNTGTGLAVFNDSPALITPALSTPSAIVLTNATGTAAGLTAGTVTTNANLTGHITSTGNASVLGSFTKAQLDTAISDGNGVYVGDTLNGTIGATTPAAGTFLGIKDNSPTLGLGYGTGAGGTVTQITSRTTGVTLDKVTGAITLVSAAGSATATSFTVTNSTVAATDTVSISLKGGTTDKYMFSTTVSAGSFEITFYTTGGTTTEQPIFQFNVHKGVDA